MGSQTAVVKTGSASSVRNDLNELERLSKTEDFNVIGTVKAVNEVLSRLSTAHMTTSQRNRFAGLEKTIYDKLETRQRVELYNFELPKGYSTVDVSEINELQIATGTLQAFKKAPGLYLLEIQRLFDQFGTDLRTTKAGKEIIHKLTPAELDFVNSRPVAQKAAPPEEPVAEAPKPVKKVPDIVPPEEMVERDINTASATAVERQGPVSKATARGVHTEISILPKEVRIVGTAPKAPELATNPKLTDIVGTDNAAAMSDSSKNMFLGYFGKGDKLSAGTTYYTAIMGWLTQATGVSGDLNATNATDPRWAVLTQIYGGYNFRDQNARQGVVDTLSAFRRGDYFAGLKSLPDNAPLKGIILDDIKSICKQMVTNIPVLVFTTGAELEALRWKGGKLTLGPHAWISHVTSQQYQADFNPDTYTLTLKPTGYTAKQLTTRVGGTAKYKPYQYATLQLDLAAETPYGVVESGSDTGQAQLIKASGTQGVLELSFVDSSGRTAGVLKAPIYYGLRGSWRFPSNSFNLTAGVGVGVAHLKGVGPVMVVADIGAEVLKGSGDFPQPIADYVWRAGIGITPTTRAGTEIPLKGYYVQTTGGEPTPLGVKMENSIGGGVETKLWGVRVSAEGRYRKALSISGLPIQGPGNAMVIFNIDASELLHRGIYKMER